MIVSDELFIICFGYRDYKRGFMEALDSGEHASSRNKHLICTHR